VPEALKELTGEDKMMPPPSSIIRAVKKWLEEQNKGHESGW